MRPSGRDAPARRRRAAPRAGSLPREERRVDLGRLADRARSVPGAAEPKTVRHLGRGHERLVVVEQDGVGRVRPLEALDVAELQLDVAAQVGEEGGEVARLPSASTHAWWPRAASRVISSRREAGTRRAFSQSRRVTRIEARLVRVVRVRLLERAQPLEQPADLVVDELLVRDPAERGERVCARASAPSGGIVTRWSQPSTPAARPRSWISASRAQLLVGRRPSAEPTDAERTLAAAEGGRLQGSLCASGVRVSGFPTSRR